MHRIALVSDYEARFASGGGDHKPKGGEYAHRQGETQQDNDERDRTTRDVLRTYKNPALEGERS